MTRSLVQLRADAVRIWQAGVAAVDSARLVEQTCEVTTSHVTIGGERFAWNRLGRIVVVGAGKAGAGMVAGLERALAPAQLAHDRFTGWVNVPADCIRPTDHIHLHAARPAGVNEPTQAGVEGSLQIERLVSSLGPDDLCLCLISGGGSALLPAPADGVTLEEKQALTRFLSGAGANIAELNTVRKRLSRFKGGGLARVCRAGTLITLIISDVLGDPLDIIASGPTVEDVGTPRDALDVLDRFGARTAGIAPGVVRYLEQLPSAPHPVPTARVINRVIGNNALAVDAAGSEAVRLGYSPALDAARQLEGAAEGVGHHLAEMAVSMRTAIGQPNRHGPDALITGGEPTVTLAPADRRGRGGRNQQLVLAAAERLLSATGEGIVLLSGGTDGEDGPTDAAGAFIDAEVLGRLRAEPQSVADALSRNDAYSLFERVGGLLKTGPTHTNVCDLRVLLVG